MKKLIGIILMIVGFIVMAGSCAAGYMSVQGPAYATQENSIAAIGFFGIIAGIVLYMMNDK